MKMKQIVVGAALVAATAVSAPAFAGATGNVGAFSAYMFRGIAQGPGAAVQGGVDYAANNGLYAGIWGSNIGFGGGTETDLYGGDSTKLGAVGVDLGAIYYYYGEEDEATTNSLDTLEFYAGATFGPAAIKYFYSDNAQFFDVAPPPRKDNGSAGYLTGSLSLPIKEGLNFNANLGYYSGDAVELFLKAIGSKDDSYIDYGVGISKTLDAGFTASFSYIDTDIKAGTIDDDAKYVIGLKKTFDL